MTIDVDTSQDRAVISPYVYGANTDMGLNRLTFRRLGGNRMTGYNWENNASNAGSDWYHSSDSYMCSVQGLTSTQCSTPGGVITAWHDLSVVMGAASELTLPMAGYVAADMNGTVAEGETAPSARWNVAPAAKGSTLTTSPNLTDGVVAQDEQVNFMVSRYGSAATANGVQIYALDNEPDLWSSTHPRIHPNPVGAAELITRSSALAKAVKAVDPNAQVFGYESYGFNGYYSLQDAPDWGSVKGSYNWYIDYYLAQMQQQSAAAGQRLLDGLSLHWYPEAQGGGQRIVFGGAGSLDTQKARVQAPRTLWDPTYQETSWIAQYFRTYLPLIPRVQGSISAYYPGTRLAFTEFSYGGESDVSGGLAVADVLGIFGKYGVYAGAYWPVENDQSYIRAAYQLFRDYDGAGARYGDTRVRANTDNVADTSAYAAIAGADDTTLHIIVLNKNFDRPAAFTFNLAGGRTYTHGAVWAFDATGPAITQRDAVSSIANNRFTYSLPPRTAAHLVLHAATGPTPTPTATITPGGPTFTPTPQPTTTPTAVPTNTPVPATDLIIYDDALAAGWDNWSWNTTVNFGNTAPVQTGARSMAVTYNAAWAGLSLRTGGPVNTAGYTGISFWVYGASGSGPVSFYVQATETGASSAAVNFTPVAGQWTPVTVTWAQLGNPGQVARLNWQEVSGSARPTFYIDELRLGGMAASPQPPAAPTATPISPAAPVSDRVIYGDALAAGWDNWSWNTTANFANPSPAQSGAASLAVTYNAAWAGLSLRTGNPLNTTGYTGVSFWVYGVSGSGTVGFFVQTTEAGPNSASRSFTPLAGQWTKVTVPLAELGQPAQIARLNWQEFTGAARPTFYMDDVRLVGP